MKRLATKTMIKKVAEYVKEDEKDVSQGVMKPNIESNFKLIMDLLQSQAKAR